MDGVIFEGADASGKTTLAAKIAQATGRHLYRAGGRPKDHVQRWDMIAEQTSHLERGSLCDRVSCISEQIYRDGLWMDDALQTVVRKYIDMGAVIVYCRPPNNVLFDANKHDWKQYDTEEWKAEVLSRQTTFVDRYDRFMAQVPCIIYDWTSEESSHIEQLLKELDTEGVMDGLRDMVRGKA